MTYIFTGLTTNPKSILTDNNLFSKFHLGILWTWKHPLLQETYLVLSHDSDIFENTATLIAIFYYSGWPRVCPSLVFLQVAFPSFGTKVIISWGTVLITYTFFYHFIFYIHLKKHTCIILKYYLCRYSKVNFH